MLEERRFPPLPDMVTVLTPALQEFPTFHTMDGRKVVENLEEFDDAREVVAALSAEYEACERPDYIERALGGPSAAAHAVPPTAAADARIPQAV